MKKPKVCILRTAGTNCDKETAFAFHKVKANPELQHVNRILEGKVSLSDYQILALPGGFTYGDDIAAGKILANELRYKLGDQLKRFLEEGKLIIGICNGFQILVKSGLLPGNNELKQEASLIINDSGKFEDRWTYLRVS
ncbi:MAG: phosphoribosylformylglycinamidine synthase subunit PurQ, partial [Candidatus Omnitrophota bacterium]